MEKLNSKFMYDNKWTDLVKKQYNEDHENKNDPYAKIVKNGILLPNKPGNQPWGIGGCINENNKLVDESTVIRAFGGNYPFDKKEIEFLNERIVYIPIIPKHWGHFLIDAISRFWIFFDDRFNVNDLKIYYSSWGWEDGKIDGNYRKFLEYLGLFDRMIAIDHPIQAQEVIIPCYTMSFCDTYNEEYKLPFKEIIKRVMNSKMIQELEPADKIYFTRTRLPSSKFKEIGEKEIEDVMKQNGFLIMSPETMSLEEQIFYINNCTIMAGMSGTIMHNIVFTNKQTKLFIFNRTCMPNSPQLMLNKLYDNEIYNIDTYKLITVKHPRDYGSGPFWICVNDNFVRFCDEFEFEVDDTKSNPNVIINYLKYYSALVYYGITRSKFAIYVYAFFKRYFR